MCTGKTKQCYGLTTCRECHRLIKNNIDITNGKKHWDDMPTRYKQGDPTL